MAKKGLPILTYPDQRLRTVAEPVMYFNCQLETLANNMLLTMYHADGIGLAATQVDVHKRIIVVDVSKDQSKPMIFINPRIKLVRGADFLFRKEGCLSFPWKSKNKRRCSQISVEAQDVKGAHFNMIAEGQLAICIQHEIDHLHGRLLIDD